MSREIKFRAWDASNNRFVKDFTDTSEYAISADGKALFMDDDGACGDPECCGERSYFLSVTKHLTLQQYTGLKDMHGVEIYEGDIISLSDEFDEGGVFPVAYEHNGYWLVGWDGNEYGWPEASDIHVIGNIYESPELLK